jgi:hypothetical protein
MRVRFFAGLLLFALSVVAIASRGAVVSEFDSREQPVLTVSGRIISSRVIGGTCHLYFGRDQKRSLVAIILPSHRARFPDRPELSFRNQHVQVSGVARENQGRIEIVLNDPDQIAIVEPGAPAFATASDHRSLRLEAKMGRLETELNSLKERLSRSQESDAKTVRGSDSVLRVLHMEMKTFQQQVHNLNRRIKDLEDRVDYLSQRQVIERRGGR